MRIAERMGYTFRTALITALGAFLGVPVAWAQTPVKIGFIYPDSGVAAQPGIDMRDGFLLYWSEIGHKEAPAGHNCNHFISLFPAARFAPASHDDNVREDKV